MSKPTVDVTFSTGGTIVEPSSGEKAAGMSVGAKFPAQWFNFYFNGIWQWVVWLAGFETTAHTWTALQSFGAGAAAGGADGSHGVFDGQGSNNKPGVYGLAGSGTTGAGVFGQGVTKSGGAFGNTGVIGVGGNGTSTSPGSLGGQGGAFQGGTGAGSAGISGNGASATAGDVDGTINTTGSAGSGAVFKGGNITSDANSRFGGDGVTATGGQGQAGYGPAFHALHGGVQVDDGASSFAGAVAVHGILTTFSSATVGTNLVVGANATINDDVFVNGSVEANGLVEGSQVVSTGTNNSLPSIAAITATLINSWATFSGATPKFYPDAVGRVHLQGRLGTGTNNTVAFNCPYHPITQQFLHAADSAGTHIFIKVDTNGDVTPTDAYTSWISLDGLSFRST